MIAVDTSSLIGYLADDDGFDVAALEAALCAETVVLPPVVFTELMSAPRLVPELAQIFSELPMLDVLDGYWHRAGLARSHILKRGTCAPCGYLNCPIVH
ncbi:MAG: hypothetical protein R3C68_16205 [Myxococcota bacterium]